MNNLSQYIITILLATFQVLIIVLNLSPIKFSKKEFVGLVFISSITCLMIANISPYMINISVSLIAVAFLYYKTKNTLITLVIAVFPTSIAVVSNYIVINTYALFNINIYNITEDFYGYIFSALLCFILCFIISKIIGYLMNNKLKVIEIDTIGKRFRLITLFSAFSLIVMYFNLIYREDYYPNDKVMFGSFILQILQFAFTIYIMYYLIRSIRIEEEARYNKELLTQLEAYTAEIEQVYWTMREFKHNYKNVLLTMTDYIRERDMEGLEAFFIKEILPESKVILEANTRIGELYNIGRRDVKGIISVKAIYAQGKGIDFSIEAKDLINDMNMYATDLSKILGIALDNAIESTLECKTPVVRIALLKQSNGIDIIIKNNCDETSINISKLFNKGFSTKGSYRGIGLNNLKKIVSKYNNASVEISVQKQEFCLKLKILNSTV